MTLVSVIKPACILLSETWLKPDITDSIYNINGFTLYRSDRINKKSGGVCVYVNKAFFPGFSINKLDIFTTPADSIWLSFKNPSFSFTLACIYRPCDSTPEFDSTFFTVIAEQSNLLNNLVILGDFNLPNINWSTLQSSSIINSESLFVQMLLDNNILQLVRDHTRFRANQTPSTLDLILTTDANLFSNIEYLPPVGISDHVALLSHIQVINYQTSNSQIKTYKKINYPALF